MFNGTPGLVISPLYWRVSTSGPLYCGYSNLVTTISVMSNLHISECELNDKYYASSVQWFKTYIYHYIGSSVVFRPNVGILSLARVTHFIQFEIDFLCSQSILHLIKVFFS